MDDQINPILLQHRAIHPHDGMPLLRFSMGWLRDDGTVFIYRSAYGYVYCGCVNYPQAIEFLTSDIQLDSGPAI